MVQASREFVLRHLAIHAQTAHVVGAIRDAGCDCVLLKGIGHEQWLYPDLRRPVSRDIDLLVCSEQMELACQVVSGLGMKPYRDPLGPLSEQHELRFVPAGGHGVPVELHTAFHFLAGQSERCWALLTAEREHIDVGGAQIEVPAVPARAVLLALHVAAHGRVGDWAIEDLRRALEMVPLEDWRRASDLAAELDVSGPFSGGLRSLTAGAQIADALGLSEPNDPALKIYWKSGPTRTLRMLGYADGHPSAGLGRLLRAEAIPSAERMRAWYPLARRGRAGLLAAHVARLARLAVSSPFLLAEFRTARAAVRDHGDLR